MRIITSYPDRCINTWIIAYYISIVQLLLSGSLLLISRSLHILQVIAYYVQLLHIIHIVASFMDRYLLSALLHSTWIIANYISIVAHYPHCCILSGSLHLTWIIAYYISIVAYHPHHCMFYGSLNIVYELLLFIHIVASSIDHCILSGLLHLSWIVESYPNVASYIYCYILG